MNTSTDIAGVTLIARESHLDPVTGIGIIKANYDREKLNVPNEFYLLFAEIFDDLDLQKWVFHADSFRIPLEVDNWEEILELFDSDSGMCNKIQDGHFILYEKRALFSMYGGFVRNSWNDMFGFDSNVDSEAIKKIDFTHKPLDENLIENVNTIFTNYDGYCWTCFSKDSELLETVIKDNKSKGFVQLKETSFRKYMRDGRP